MNTKRLATMFVLLFSSFAMAGELFPLSSATNLTNNCNGLHIYAVADKMTYGTNDKPLITVTFSNQSSKVIALINHFAYTAEGPSFILRIDDNNELQQRMGFAEQIFFRDPYWILLKPSDVHRFQSRLSDVLPLGRHCLQVRYFVSGPAEKTIAECRKDPSCPSDFWHGYLFSDVVNIEVTQEIPNIGVSEKDFPVCVSKNIRSKVSVAKKAIEDFDGCRIEIQGILLEFAVPTLEVTSHTVGNGRNIVRLILNKSLVQNWKEKNVRFGDKVIVAGTVKAKNIKVPEILVEDIQRKP
ncbi:MAG: hypothetical protein L6437_10700 [Kiritimatiellae bacterium]|nr:hypothetical protein [Kiritimatiellia bacterium]